jgi:hypothetical protein
VVLEGDSMEVVKALRDDDVCWNCYGHLIHDAKIQLRRLVEWKVLHVRRTANMKAHNLAKMELSTLTGDYNYPKVRAFLQKNQPVQSTKKQKDYTVKARSSYLKGKSQVLLRLRVCKTIH